MELLKNSIAMQEQMLACKGFLVIGYSLEKVKYKVFVIFIINFQTMYLFFYMVKKFCRKNISLPIENYIS